MIESEKKLKELQRKIAVENRKVISQAVILLRSEEPYKGAIGLLVELFNRTNDHFIKDLVRNFLNDLKEPAARDEVIAEVQKDHKSDTTSMLIASCWQSGLDYSAFATEISRAFVKGDFQVALECFTVLEESAHNITPMKRNELSILLSEKRENFTVEKNKLLDTLLTIMAQ